MASFPTTTSSGVTGVKNRRSSTAVAGIFSLRPRSSGVDHEGKETESGAAGGRLSARFLGLRLDEEDNKFENEKATYKAVHRPNGEHLSRVWVHHLEQSGDDETDGCRGCHYICEESRIYHLLPRAWVTGSGQHRRQE